MDSPDVMQKRFFREIFIAKDAINVEARTVSLAFSSEQPVERFFGVEILDHGPQSVRLGRLSDGGAVLWNHNPDEQYGVVESANIGSDRVGRAVVRFGKSDCADEMFQDIVDGIKRKVSVGYQIHNMILDSKTDAGEVYRVTDWEPLEISIVSIPADNSVGVGRAAEQPPITPEKEITMTDPNPQEQPKAPPVQIDVRAIQDDTRKKELARINDLEKIGQTFAQFGGVELARQHISEGKTSDELNAAILARAGLKKPVSGDIGLTDEEVKSFSFVRAMHALANPRDRAAQEAAGFEFEVSAAAANKAGKASRGIMVPYDVLKAPMQADAKRADLIAGTGNLGGYTVQTNLLAQSFIDLLRNKIVVAGLGATTLNGLQGNIAIPRQTGAATAYWVAENSAVTESEQAFDQVTMSPKTVGAFSDFSRRLLIQSSIDVEALVRNDLSQVLALAIDLAALYGSGSSNQPLGIKGTSSIKTVDFAADTPTWAEVISMETQLAAANSDQGKLAYLTNATMRGTLKGTAKASGYPVYIWENGEINGYKAEVSNQVTVGTSTGQDMFFADWSSLLLGFWSGLDLMVDPYTGATAGTVRMIAMQDTDVAVRHPESFCRANNSL